MGQVLKHREVGDGVLINASHPSDVESAMGSIKEGAAKAGKKMDELEVAAYTSFSIAEDEKKALKAVTPVVAYIVAGSPEVVLTKHRIQVESANRIREAITKGAWKDAFSEVTPEMVDAFSICGTPETCVEKIDGLLKLGVTQIVIGSPVGPNIRKSIYMAGNEILTHYMT